MYPSTPASRSIAQRLSARHMDWVERAWADESTEIVAPAGDFDMTLAPAPERVVEARAGSAWRLLTAFVLGAGTAVVACAVAVSWLLAAS